MTSAKPVSEAIPAPALVQTQPRNSALAMLRGFCILGVVTIHFTGGRVSFDNAAAHTFVRSLYLGVNQYFQFVVPAFVFLSGWALGGKRLSGIGEWGAFYRRRGRALLIPYFFFVLVYLGFECPSDLIAAHSHSLGQFIVWVCYYGMDTHGYFVPLIAQLYLLYPVLDASNQRLDGLTAGGRRLGEAVTALLLAGIMGLWCGLCWKHELSWNDIRPLGLFYLLYFYLGMLWRRVREPEPRALWIMAGAASLVHLGGWWFGMAQLSALSPSAQLTEMSWSYCRGASILQSLGACGIMAFLLSAAPRLSIPLIREWGDASMTIFLWHGILLWGSVLGFHRLWSNVPVNAAALLIPALVCTLLSVAGWAAKCMLRFLHR